MCGRARLSSDVSEIKLVFRIPPDRPTPNVAAGGTLTHGLKGTVDCLRQRDVDERGVEARQGDPDHQGQDRPVALRDRQTVFGGVYVVMSAQRDQGAEMAPRLSLRRRAVPDRAAQPTHSGGRERSLRAETQPPVRQRQMRLVDHLAIESESASAYNSAIR